MRNLKCKPTLTFGDEEEDFSQPQPRNVAYAALKPQRPTVRVGGHAPLRSVAPLPSFIIPVQNSPKPRLHNEDRIGRQIQSHSQDRALRAPQTYRRSVRRHSSRPFGQFVDWLNEELTLTMSKLSLLGMVFGLMFMGALFFVVGFLSAVTMYGTGKPDSSAQVQPAQAWAAHSQQAQQAQPHPHGGGMASGLVGSLTGFEARRASNVVGRSTTGATLGALSHVPAPLRPFASHALMSGTGGATKSVTHGIYGAAHTAANPFGRNAAHYPAPQPMPYPTQNQPQQYSAPAYAPVPAPIPYGQPAQLPPQQYSYPPVQTQAQPQAVPIPYPAQQAGIYAPAQQNPWQQAR